MTDSTGGSAGSVAPSPESKTPPGPSGNGLAVGGLAALAYLAFKAKGALFALKAVPLGKLGLTMFSALAMVWVEAQRSGLGFAIGFVLLILIHEMGHGYRIRKAGLVAGWPVFIPFFGAMIALKGRTPSREVEAEIAFGGPLWGTYASLVVAGLALVTSSRLFLALAHTGFFLNLFNLVPMAPLDGGRIARAFSPKAWIVGGVLLGGLFLMTWSPQLLLIGIMAISHARRSAGPVDDEPVDPKAQKLWALRYFGLSFALGACVFFSQRLLQR